MLLTSKKIVHSLSFHFLFRHRKSHPNTHVQNLKYTQTLTIGAIYRVLSLLDRAPLPGQPPGMPGSGPMARRMNQPKTKDLGPKIGKYGRPKSLVVFHVSRRKFSAKQNLPPIHLSFCFRWFTIPAQDSKASFWLIATHFKFYFSNFQFRFDHTKVEPKKTTSSWQQCAAGFLYFILFVIVWMVNKLFVPNIPFPSRRPLCSVLFDLGFVFALFVLLVKSKIGKLSFNQTVLLFQNSFNCYHF